MSMANEINNLTRLYRERLQYPPDYQQDSRPKGVFTNFRATKVNYEYNRCYVEATNCSNGQQMRFEGDAIVCTPSIGVLQSGALEFNPPLPSWKTQAINELRMGNYVKVFVQFSERWWGNHEYIFCASDQKGQYPMWMPIGTNRVLMCTVSGQFADRVEKLDEESLKHEI